MEKPRIAYIDLAKCLAIWLVLWGHAMTQLMPSHDLNGNSAFVWLYSFHMPLFMLMSGLFASKTLQMPFFSMLWSKFKQLIVPTLLFGVLWLVADYARFMGGSLQESGLCVVHHFATCYWFLKSLFICFIVGWMVMHSNPKWLAAIAFWVAFLVLQHWDFTCFKMGSMLPFFLLGIWLKPHLEWIKNRAPELFIASAVLHSMLILTGIYNQNLAFPTYFFANPEIASALKDYGIYLLTAFCGCVLCISFCEMLEEKLGSDSRIAEWMRKVGTLTLWIYLWQKILLEILLPKVLIVEMPLWCFDLLFTPIVAIAALVICYFFSLLTTKVVAKTQ